MNILMLGRWLPAPRHPVRATREYQFAHRLARSHRLTLAFITDNPDATGSISALRNEFGDLEFAAVPRAWKSLASAVRLATGESCTLSYFRSETLRTRLADRLRRTHYDLVFVSSSGMIQYALDVDPVIPMVVDFGELDSEWWSRQAARGSFPSMRFFRTEAHRLRIAEAVAAQRAIRCVAETADAARIVQSLAPGAPITVIPSGVDVDSASSSLRAGKVPTVLVNTSLDTEAEVTDTIAFCRTILPEVRARVSNARFVVASKGPLPARVAGHLVGVETAAPITDVRVLFHSHVVAAAPRWVGTDLRSSALEPMGAGIPVVTTSKVRDQLGAQAGRDMHVSDRPLDFARHVVELLENAPLREEMGASGRAFIQANFSWGIFSSRLADLLSGVIAGPTPSGTESEPRSIPAALGG